MAKHNGRGAMDWMHLARSLRARIDETGYSLRELEGITGIDHATLSRATNGKPCTVASYLAICSEFRIPVWAAYSRKQLVRNSYEFTR